MELTEQQLLTKSLEIVLEMCGDATDMSGNPEVLHPLGVSGRVVQYGPEAQALALLHDVIEDYPSKITYTELSQAGIPESVLDGLVAITRVKSETYKEYIQRVSANKLATIVKIEDITYNNNRSDRGLTRSQAKGLRDRWTYAKLYLQKTLI